MTVTKVAAKIIDKTAVRIAKFIAKQGYTSRRQAEQLVIEGKVRVNDELITSPARHVTATDKIYIAGQPLKLIESTTRLWLYNKPVGLITTHIDTHNRPTVFANLPASLPRVVSVGRLDLNSEGLLLLTNNGNLARYLELPKNALLRVYKVRVFGEFDLQQLKQQVERGITTDEQVFYKAVELKLLKAASNSWFEITLNEGKNREIRKIFAHFNLQVNRLIRTKYGPFDLDNLPINTVQEIPYNQLTKYLPVELLQ